MEAVLVKKCFHCDDEISSNKHKNFCSDSCKYLYAGNEDGEEREC